VPDLALKKDAIPGFINENWTNINEPGVYRQRQQSSQWIS